MAEPTQRPRTRGTAIENASPQRTAIATRAAHDIPDGWFVNLGIGIPTLIASLVPADREVIFHSENGLLGIGPAPAEAQRDPWLINAGKKYVTLRAGGSFFNQSDSFAMIRGHHLDLCVLGALEVSPRGDLANWTTSSSDTAPAVGGAMDLAVGARRVWVLMEHTTKEGQSKLVQDCSYPLTAPGVVTRIYTDLCVLDVTPSGFEVVEIHGGLDFDTLQSRTGAPLHRAGV